MPERAIEHPLVLARHRIDTPPVGSLLAYFLVRSADCFLPSGQFRDPLLEQLLLRCWRLVLAERVDVSPAAQLHRGLSQLIGFRLERAGPLVKLTGVVGCRVRLPSESRLERWEQREVVLGGQDLIGVAGLGRLGDSLLDRVPARRDLVVYLLGEPLGAR